VEDSLGVLSLSVVNIKYLDTISPCPIIKCPAVIDKEELVPLAAMAEAPLEVRKTSIFTKLRCVLESLLSGAKS
jgi:hypothetical protein